MFHVNLTIKAILAEPSRLDDFIRQGLAPELGMDPVMLESTPPDVHRDIAARLAASGITPSVHLPFFDLQPGSVDPLILGATRNRLHEAFRVAAIYAPSHLVAHAAYNPFLYIHSYPAWRDRARQTFAAIAAIWPDHPPLYLENTHETNPAHVAGLVEALRREPGVRTGICFDVGHWHSFGEGAYKEHLNDWMDAFAPYLKHLHLHDNDGSFDHHLGLGQGRIPWGEVFDGLTKRGLTPSVTFEPHTADDTAHTLAFIQAHPHWFDRLGVRIA